MDNNIGMRIRQYRKAKGWTQEKLAEYAGLNRVAVASYEQGKYLSSLTALESLSNVLDVPLSALSGSNNLSNSGEEDVWTIRERLRSDPDYRLLFDAAMKASPDHIKAAAAMLRALESQETRTVEENFPEESCQE